jgi:hypothetical protein
MARRRHRAFLFSFPPCFAVAIGISGGPVGSASAAESAPADSSPTSAPASPPPSPPTDNWSAGSFPSDPLGAAASAMDLTLKMYGDSGFAMRNHADQPWPTSTANANVYRPGVWNSFFAPRLDLFGSSDVAKLSFLTEAMFEAQNNQIAVDLERVQISYLFANWLRVRAGRTHLAWGYYNDSYHHGNFFELTTSRPYSVNFEDSFGIILSHNVGVGIDGTFELGSLGAVRYDAEVGNGRAADVTSVALQFADKNEKVVNVRIRWLPLDGLIVGVNGMRDVVPSLAASGSPTPAPTPDRPETEELVLGAHLVYTEHHLLLDVEGFAMRHNPTGAPSTNLYGGFAEVGYAIGAVTPYVRGEAIRFPSGGDLVYQWAPDSAQGILAGTGSVYFGARDFSDFRAGVKWVPVPQLALKLEGDRVARGTQDQEIATVKAAFGF